MLKWSEHLREVKIDYKDGTLSLSKSLKRIFEKHTEKFWLGNSFSTSSEIVDGADIANTKQQGTVSEPPRKKEKIAFLWHSY